MEKISNENLLKIKNKCGVYKIGIASHFYIGSSNHIGNRLRTHRNSLVQGNHHNHTMQNCFNKYGIDSMVFEIVEECPEECLIEREGYYIQTLQPDMNHILDPARPALDEESIKLGIETRKKNDVLLKRRPVNIKKVYQYDLNGTFIQEWKAATDAAAYYNASVTAICACCNNRVKTHMGYQWSYQKENKSKPIKNYRGNTIVQYDCDKNPIMIWRSFAAIAKELHISSASIEKASETGALYKKSYWKINPDTIEDFQEIALEDNPVLQCKKYENNNPIISHPIHQYDMSGNYIKEFPSMREAARSVNAKDITVIRMCAEDKYKHYKSAYGYRWSYEKCEHLPEYVNNSAKAVNRPIIIFDCIEGEEIAFESIAAAVKHYEPNPKRFDSSCAILSMCANDHGYYLHRYIAKSGHEYPYVLPIHNTAVYNVVKDKVFANSKRAAEATGMSVYHIKKLCKQESNKEWLYVNQCARVKLRESGKVFEER